MDAVQAIALNQGCHLFALSICNNEISLIMGRTNDICEKSTLLSILGKFPQVYQVVHCSKMLYLE